MKNITLHLFLLAQILVLPTLSAQNWDDLLQQPNATFEEIRQAYYAAHPEALEWSQSNENEEVGDSGGEEDGMYSKFKRWESFAEPRLNEQGIFDPTAAMRAYQTYLLEHPPGHAPSAANWSIIGPTSPPSPTTSNNGAIGRIDCFGFHPTDAGTYWAGSPSGGLWKTTDNGQNWLPLSDMWSGLGIADIYVHAANPDTIIVATGTRDGGTVAAFGILRSIDQGATFQNIGLTSVNRFYRLLADPANAAYMVAATNQGVFYSDDGGTNWQQSAGVPTSGSGGIVWDMEAKPGDFTVIYASSYGRFFKSTDAGQSFTETVLPFPAGEVTRTGIAVTAAKADNVYLSCVASSNNRFYGFYKSWDEGSSFSLTSSPTDSAFYVNGAFFGLLPNAMGNQGSYDWTVSVSPTDTNEIYIGGVSMMRTTTGGAPWYAVSSSAGGGGSVHVDMHSSEYHPGTGEFYVGSDGGIYRYTGGTGHWDRLMGGLAVTQNYRLGQSIGDEGPLLIGNQDNGIMVRRNGQWFFEIVGDGMESLVNPANPNEMFALTQNGRLSRSRDSGQTWSVILQASDLGQSGAWTTPFDRGYRTSDTYYAAYQSVWKSTDGGDNFINMNGLGALSPSSTLRTLAIAPSDEDVVYTSNTTSDFFRTLDGGGQWDEVPVPSSFLRDIAVHPDSSHYIWVCGSNKVYFSNDSGDTWTDVSGTLPNLSINTIVYQRGTNNGLYVGTDMGVYYKDDNLGAWQLYSTGLPNVVVNDLEINYCSGKIRAATYGRSLWESDLFSFNPAVVCCPEAAPNMSPQNDLSVCGYSSAKITAGTPPGAYQLEWFKNDTTIMGQTGPELTVTTDGAYSAKYVDPSNLCFGFESKKINVQFKTCETKGCENVNRYVNQGPGNVTNVWVEGPFATPMPGVDIEVCILLDGDFDGATEQFNVSDENANFLILTDGDVQCGESTPQCFNISISDFNTWSADGEILFVFDPVGTGASATLCNNNRLCVSLNYPVENECFTPDTLSVNADPILSNKYTAQELVISSGRVPEHGIVEMQSGGEINLDTTFGVDLGGDYYAHISNEACQLESRPPTVVTNTNNSGYGSLRNAMYFANANADLDTITFDIPGTPPHVIQLKNTLPRLESPTIIDGSTQPINGYGGTHPRIILDGNTLDTCGYCSGIVIRGNNRYELYGLTIKDFLYSGIEMFQANSDTIIIGAAGKGNVIAGNGNDPLNSPNLFFNQIGNTSFFSIQGNIIGLYEDESVPIQQGLFGITIQKLSEHNYGPWQGIIGGHLPGEGNIFGGNNASISFQGFGSGNIWIKGNRFNVDSNGNAYSPISGGLSFGLHGKYFLIGGPSPAYSNSFSGYNFAMSISNDSIQVKRNSFFCNSQGILLSSGANCGMAPPAITTATTVTITGTAVAGDTVQVYLNDTCPSGLCQGEFYLGSTIADGAGDWSLAAPFEHPMAAGDQVTATATQHLCTSGFSACATATSLQPPEENGQ